MVRYKKASVAQKMSWAANQETSRVEDIAYCLLGLFGIYMPPLYGEEEHAFTRLQYEILKTSADQSLSAWRADDDVSLKYPIRGLLAFSPRQFARSGHIINQSRSQIPFQITNQGLHIHLFSKLVTESSENQFSPIIRKTFLGCIQNALAGGRFEPME
jgi:hypothetical protein